jgi:hypothetical protein
MRLFLSGQKKRCFMRVIASAVVTGSLLASCAGTGGGVSKTNQLAPGMSATDVRAVLGGPSQTQFVSNKWVWKYSLHEPWKGFVPYYLVFGRESQKLEEWFTDEAEYMRQQQLWLQATQKHEIDVRVRP